LATLEEAEQAVTRLMNSPAMTRWKRSSRKASLRKGSPLKNSSMRVASLQKQRSFSDAAVVFEMEQGRKEKMRAAVYAERKAHAEETLETLLRMSAIGETQSPWQITSLSDISKIDDADVQLLLDCKHWESEVAARAAAYVDAEARQTVQGQQQKQQELKKLEQSHAQMQEDLKLRKSEEAELQDQIQLYQTMAAKLQQQIQTIETDMSKIQSQMDHINILLYQAPVSSEFAGRPNSDWGDLTMV